MPSIYYSKITYEKLQLKRLGKKLKLFIIRQNEKFSSGLEISSKIYGPTSEKNCLNKMKTLKTKKGNTMTTRKKADLNFQTKIENKKAKFQALSVKLKEKSNQLYGDAMTKASFIPMGQPLMPDHYSYKRDRKFRDSINNGIRKSIETDRKAEYYENKAENYGNGNAIMSGDPEAFEKLKAKIKMLESHVINCKEANKVIRSLTSWDKFDLWLKETFKDNQTDINKIVKDKIEYGRYKLYNLASPVCCQCSYELTNANSEIRRLKQRLKSLESHDERPSFYFKNNLVEAKEEDARINLYFNGKPDEAIRSKVKAKGFKWSPTRMAWTRQVTSSTPNWFFDDLPKFLDGLVTSLKE